MNIHPIGAPLSPRQTSVQLQSGSTTAAQLPPQNKNHGSSANPTDPSAALRPTAGQSQETVGRDYLQSHLFIGSRGPIKVFYDVTAVYEDPIAMRAVADALRRSIGACSPDVLAAPEARGWPLVGVARQVADLPAMLLHKKQPGGDQIVDVTYQCKTNGSAHVKLYAPKTQSAAPGPKPRVLIIDDGTGAGDTLLATIRLCESAGMQVVGLFAMIRHIDVRQLTPSTFDKTWGDKLCTVFDLTTDGSRLKLPPRGVPKGDGSATKLAAVQFTPPAMSPFDALIARPDLFGHATTQLRNATRGATYVAALDMHLWPLAGALMPDKRLILLREKSKLPDPVLLESSGQFAIRDKADYRKQEVVLLTRDAAAGSNANARELLVNAGMSISKVLRVGIRANEELMIEEVRS